MCLPKLRLAAFSLAATLIPLTALAATFVVPTDRDLIHRADAVIVGSALASSPRMNAEGGIETVTPISVEEVIFGSGIKETINVVEPGGDLGDRASIIAGVPRFVAGQRMLLLLSRTGADRWAVSELVLGKFSFDNDGPEPLLVRDEAEIVGWDPDRKVHREQRRSAERFLQFVRDELHGRMPAANYFIDEGPAPRFWIAPTLFPVTLAVYSANSYTMVLSGSSGGRWTVFPSAVSFYSGVTQEAGAPGGGITAITTAFASWNNDSLSNVNYAYAGVDNGSHTQGLHAADGANTILFERDLS